MVESELNMLEIARMRDKKVLLWQTWTDVTMSRFDESFIVCWPPFHWLMFLNLAESIQ